MQPPVRPRQFRLRAVPSASHSQPPVLASCGSAWFPSRQGIPRRFPPTALWWSRNWGKPSARADDPRTGRFLSPAAGRASPCRPLRSQSAWITRTDSSCSRFASMGRPAHSLSIWAKGRYLDWARGGRSSIAAARSIGCSSGQGGYRLGTHGGRVPMPWLIGTAGWAMFVHRPYGSFDLTGREGQFTPVHADSALPLDVFILSHARADAGNGRLCTADGSPRDAAPLVAWLPAVAPHARQP